MSKLENYEGNSFNISSIIPKIMLFREEEFISRFNLYPKMSIKTALNLKISNLLREKTNLESTHGKPDLYITVNFIKRDVEVKAAPLFIKGRYLKLVRGLLQTKNFRNSSSLPSVEELITTPLINHFNASKSKFHGVGREDVDARMLGNGRPFVVELLDPKKRKVDLDKIEKEINEYGKGKIQVLNLTFSSRDEMRRLKALSPKLKKVYRVVVAVEEGVSCKDLEKIEGTLKNCVIKQKTPTRVLSHRTDKVRFKKIYDIRAKKISNNELELIILSEGGLYIKEFVNGDEGRTTPSLLDVLKKKVKFLELDVVYVAENIGSGLERLKGGY